MGLLLMTFLATLFLYFCFVFVDTKFPRKSVSEATLLEKHTEIAFQNFVDHAGNSHQVDVKNCVFIAQNSCGTYTEIVTINNFNKAVVGQNLKIIKSMSRFTKKFIKYEFEV